ncbi:MAG: tetratricopeptide repeat protein [Richelia sp. RM2_1_2]|nr:tetratricopeptide repeat protein [Richelia sp. RM2_1_2]
MSPAFSQIPAFSLNNPHSLVQQGEELYRQQQLSSALEYFQKAANIFAKNGDKLNQAITLTNLGRLQLELGKAKDALDNWETAKTIYIQLGDKTGVTRSQIYQAHALQQLGLLPRACSILLQALEIQEQSCEALTAEKIEQTLKLNQEFVTQQPDVLLLTGWRSLGDVLRVIGKLDESRLVLEK